VEVELTDGWETERFLVPVRTVDLADRIAAVKAIASADVVGTAVGARMLPAVLDLIAEGLKRAARPVNVIAFENHENAARIIRKGLRMRLGPGVDRHGFTGAVIARAVAHRVFTEDGHVRVVGDLPSEVVIDGLALVDPVPLVQDFIPVDDFRAYYRRKLYRFSAGHATTAYLGKLKGYRYLHAAAMEVIAARLEEWGMLPEGVSAADSLAPEGQYHRRWMVHGTSHHLGLDVHDCAQARREMYMDAELRPGMCFTIEPGLYFREDDLLVPEEMRGTGVRIEDDVVVREDGSVERLTQDVPRTVEEVEAWVSGLIA